MNGVDPIRYDLNSDMIMWGLHHQHTRNHNHSTTMNCPFSQTRQNQYHHHPHCPLENVCYGIGGSVEVVLPTTIRMMIYTALENGRSIYPNNHTTSTTIE